MTLVCRENIAVETPIEGIDGMTAPDKADAGTGAANTETGTANAGTGTAE